ncbi:MAG: sigma-70 family RNA polymerase sigma factor [Planctomycetota bacterium]
MAESELAQTLRDAASGDAGAWTRLVTAYSGRVFGLLVKQCGDRELAEELAQATFVKVVEKLTEAQTSGAPGAYEERGRFESWLFRIAMNKLRDEARRKKRQARTMDMSPGADREEGSSAMGSMAATAGAGGLGENPVELLSRGEQVQRMQACIETLPEADREVLYLRHTAGLSFAQIAETLEQPLGTVLARGHRALGKLKKMMIDDVA